MSVAKSLGTTNFDTIECDFLYCGGTIVGSSLLPVTNDVSGTFTGSRVDCTTLNVKGTQTGSVANITTIGVKGTVTGSGAAFTALDATLAGFAGTTTGSVVNSGTANITSGLFVGAGVSGTFTGSVANVTTLGVKGSTIGSVMTIGTANITSLPTNDAVGFGALKGTSVYALVGTILGSQAHGLAATPVAVMIAPMFDFGTFGAPYQRAAADGTNCFVSAGTMGTVQITALA
jgi:hypothetical protein